MKINLKDKWFTMVELIVVIAIIAVLSVISWIALTQFVWKSKEARVKADLSVISDWIDVYLINWNLTWGIEWTGWTYYTWFSLSFMEKNSSWDNKLSDILQIERLNTVNPWDDDIYHIAYSWKKYIIAWQILHEDGDKWHYQSNFTLSGIDEENTNWSWAIENINW